MKKLNVIVVTFILVCSFVFAGCVSTSIDPVKASEKLAPITRTAQKNSEGVYYCIFVRSFEDSDGDGTGDFNGITEKLDYLNDGDETTTDDLGITGIWLMPIYKSGTYHGYDVEDYYSVNPDYGTMQDFETLVTEAKKRGISVMLDITCNHSSVNNPWFIDSMDPSDPHRDWYRWAQKDDPNCNVNRSIWGHSAWHYYMNGWYYAGLFDSCMPEFNLSNEGVKKEFSKVCKFWIDKGVTGFRFDAASHVFNPAELRSGETSMPASTDWWSYISNEIKTDDSASWCVGECWEGTPLRAEYLKGLDSVFHFDMGTQILNALKAGRSGTNGIAKQLSYVYETYKETNPAYIDAPFLSNHDQARFMTLLNNPDRDKQLNEMKCAAAIYMTTEGVPFIYYGEEIGMKGSGSDENVRTPFIWNNSVKSKSNWYTKKYGKIDKYNKDIEPLNNQEKDKDSLVEYYKRLIRLKTAYPALYRGRMTPLWTGKTELVSWMMRDTADAGVVAASIASGDTAFVIHNVSNKEITTEIPEQAISQLRAIDLIFKGNRGVVLNGTSITLPPYSSAVLGAFTQVNIK
jgi:glycosidase